MTWDDNSLHLWVCAQPPEFDLKALMPVPNQEMPTQPPGSNVKASTAVPSQELPTQPPGSNVKASTAVPSQELPTQPPGSNVKASIAVPNQELPTQPPGSNVKASIAVPTQKLTPAQNEERLHLADTAYFGWRTDDAGFLALQLSLPLLVDERVTKPEGTIPRAIYLAETRPPTISLGTLDQLPLEILYCVVSSLDISAIDQFKAVNRRSFEVVNTHPQFKIINEQAHDTLRGLRAIKTDHMITVQTLFDKLCTMHCSECGDYGGYIYLVTFERLCGRCLTEKDRYLPLPELQVLKEFGLTLEILDSLPRFQPYHGLYGKGHYRYYYSDSNSTVIDRASAYDAGILYHGSFEAMQKYVADTKSDIWKQYKSDIEGRKMKLAAERAVKRDEKKAKRRPALKKLNTDDTSKYITGSQYIRYDRFYYKTIPWSPMFRQSLRYQAVMRVPWLNRQSGRDEWGFHCVGCIGLHEWPNHFSREFIMSTFREHLRECGPIRGGVHHINDCCKKGTCRIKNTNTKPVDLDAPYWLG
ncbi:MAG: hypothetical protein Q9163_005617 [Psora crenata]